MRLTGYAASCIQKSSSPMRSCQSDLRHTPRSMGVSHEPNPLCDLIPPLSVSASSPQAQAVATQNVCLTTDRQCSRQNPATNMTEDGPAECREAATIAVVSARPSPDSVNKPWLLTVEKDSDTRYAGGGNDGDSFVSSVAGSTESLGSSIFNYRKVPWSQLEGVQSLGRH